MYLINLNCPLCPRVLSICLIALDLSLVKSIGLFGICWFVICMESGNQLSKETQILNCWGGRRADVIQHRDEKYFHFLLLSQNQTPFDNNSDNSRKQFSEENSTENKWFSFPRILLKIKYKIFWICHTRRQN